MYAYGSASSATLTALVPTAAMRTGDFSKAQLDAYLGPQGPTAQQTVHKDANGNVTAIGPDCGGSDANICYVPQTGPQGQALVNGARAAPAAAAQQGEQCGLWRRRTPKKWGSERTIIR